MAMQNHKIETTDRAAYVADGYRRGWTFTPLNGKAPTLKNWTKRDRETEEQAQQWAASGNIGLRTGAASGVIVIDIDFPKNDCTSLETATTWARIDLPDSVTVATGGGGMQIYYAIPAGVEVHNSAGKLAPGVDIRGEGGQVVFPGSIHPDSGAIYNWLPGHAPDDLPLADLPAWVIADLSTPVYTPPPERPQQLDISYNTYIQSAVDGECLNVATAGEGTRNDTLNRAAFALGTLAAHGLQRTDAEAELTSAAIDAGLPAHEIKETFASAWAGGTKSPRIIPELNTAPTNGKRKTAPPPAMNKTLYPDTGGEAFSDRAAAIRLRPDHSDDLRHSTGLGWMVYNGGKWTQDEKQPRQFVRDIAETIRKTEGPKVAGKNPDLIKRYFRLAARLEQVKGQQDILAAAEIEDPFNVDPDKWDGDPYLVNFQNGTYDLRLGEMLPHDPDHYLTQMIPHDYDPAATCPRWLQFMREVFNGDQDLIEYIRWSLGYAFTGLTTYHVFYIAHGIGANGKSTFLDAAAYILGDYATSLNPEELMQQQHSAHPTGMMGLRGARFVQAQETTQGKRLNESLVKNMTGGDRMSARKLYCDYVEFMPQFKLWMATNHMPEINDDSGAMWRRVRAIPFNQIFKGKAADPHLGAALRAEAPGIIAWAMEAFIKCQSEPDPLPPAVVAATAEYRASQDTIAEFLESMTDRRNPAATVERRALYDAFLTFSGGKAENMKSFNERMKMHGYREIRTDFDRKTVRSWRGLKLRNAD